MRVGGPYSEFVAEPADALAALAQAYGCPAKGPDNLRDDEPRSGSVLNVGSTGLVRVRVRLEDELGVEPPDCLYVDRAFNTVDDVVGVVATAVEHASLAGRGGKAAR